MIQKTIILALLLALCLASESPYEGVIKMAPLEGEESSSESICTYQEM